MTLTPPPKPRESLWGVFREFSDGLAGRLLALTAVIVFAIEVCVFVPALARYHEDWLRERINLAQIAALALEPGNDIADALEDQLLTNAEVQHVALQREGERVLLLGDPNAGPPTTPPVTYDYTNATSVQRFEWAYQTFFAPPGRILRVLAKPRFETGEFIEVVLREAIERFRDKPEDESIAFPRSRGADEIGRAQRAAADMAEQVRNSLRQKE